MALEERAPPTQPPPAAEPGAIERALGVLDIPGGIARRTVGALAGVLEPSEILNLEDRFGGAEFLRRLGVEPGAETPIGSARAIGGFALEVALDPLTLFGGVIGRGVAGAAKGIAGAGLAGLRAAEVSGLPALRGLAATALGARRLFSAKAAVEAVPDAEELLRRLRQMQGRMPWRQRENLGLLRRNEALVSEDAARSLADLMEVPGAREEFLIARGVPAAKLRFAPLAKEVPADVRRQLAALAPNEELLVRRYLLGEPGSEIPGKLGRGGLLSDPAAQKLGMEDDYVARGILLPAHMKRRLQREGAQHVAHLWRKGFDLPENVVGDDMGRLARLIPGSELMSRKQLLREAERRAKGITEVREILGRLKDIQARYGGVDLFERNLARIGFGEGERWIAATSLDDFLRGIKENPKWAVEVPKKAKPPPGFVVPRLLPTTPLWIRRHFVGPRGAPNTALHEEVAKALFGGGGWLANLAGRESRFVDFWRNTLSRYWRGWTLAPFPSWMLRNTVGNFWNNYLAGVGPTRAAEYADAARVMLQVRRHMATGAAEGTIRLAEGKAVPMAKLLEELRDEAILYRNLSYTDAGAGLAKFAFEKPDLLDLAKLDPAQNLLTRAGFGLNGVLEDWARVAHYLAKRRDGLSATEAAASVRKYLFDLDQLSPFERGPMRDIIPFYAWSRQNIPLQVTALLTKPQRVAWVGKVKVVLDEQGRVDVPEEAMPLWLQGQVTLPVSRVGKRLSVFALNNWLPLADLSEIRSPEAFGEFVMKSLHPLPRVLIEQRLNWNFFFKRQIEAFAGQTERLFGREQWFGIPVTRRRAHVLRTIRMLNEADRILTPLLGLEPASAMLLDGIQQITGMDALVRFTTGLKARPVDLSEGRLLALKGLERRQNDLTFRLKLALQRGRPGEAENLRAQIARIISRRKFLAGWDPTRHPGALAAAEMASLSRPPKGAGARAPSRGPSGAEAAFSRTSRARAAPGP